MGRVSGDLERGQKRQNVACVDYGASTRDTRGDVQLSTVRRGNSGAVIVGAVEPFEAFGVLPKPWLTDALGAGGNLLADAFSSSPLGLCGGLFDDFRREAEQRLRRNRRRLGYLLSEAEAACRVAIDRLLTELPPSLANELISALLAGESTSARLAEYFEDDEPDRREYAQVVDEIARLVEVARQAIAETDEAAARITRDHRRLERRRRAVDTGSTEFPTPSRAEILPPLTFAILPNVGGATRHGPPLAPVPVSPLRPPVRVALAA